MKISLVQQQAITARMAMVVGAEEFDRLFLGVQIGDLDADILYVYALNAESAEELEEKYSLHMSIVAADILKRPVGIVMVLPRALA